MAVFDPIADEVCDGKEDEVDAKARFEDASSFSVGFFPGVGFLSPFVEVVHGEVCTFWEV